MSVDFLHDPCCYRRFYDLVSYRKADECGTYHYDDRCDRRMAVLYAFCQQILCNHKYFKAMCDVDDRVCHHYRAGIEISERRGGVDLCEGYRDSQLQGELKSSIINLSVVFQKLRRPYMQE